MGWGPSSSSRSWKLKERRGIGLPMRAGSLTGSSPNSAACRDLHAPLAGVCCMLEEAGSYAEAVKHMGLFKPI